MLDRKNKKRVSIVTRTIMACANGSFRESLVESFRVSLVFYRVTIWVVFWAD